MSGRKNKLDFTAEAHPALVYGRVLARAGYVDTRRRWVQAEVAEKIFIISKCISPCLRVSAVNYDFYEYIGFEENLI